jgi:glycosyltransferase involved in cell wall biosynthesis
MVSGTLSAIWFCLRHPVDVVHVHWPFPHGIMALAAKWVSGVAVVANCHGAELAMGRRKAWVRRFLQFCLRRSDVTLCNSSHTQAEIKRQTGVVAEVCPYGATVPVPAGGNRARREGPVRLLFCGRLIERKGIDVLLRAMVDLRRHYAVHLTITGEGNMKPAWEKLCEELELQAQVKFAGFVSTIELARLYHDCDIYVHPAVHDRNGDTEGLGVVLIEALANAKPVVASEVGGIVDVIQHNRTGLLVPEKQPGELARAIGTLIEDPRLARRLGKEGHRFAVWHFDWNRIALQLENEMHRARTKSRCHQPRRRHAWAAKEVGHA